MTLNEFLVKAAVELGEANWFWGKKVGTYYKLVTPKEIIEFDSETGVWSKRKNSYYDQKSS